MSIAWPNPMPSWVDHAFRHRGLKEIPGKNTNPTIRKWLIELKAWWTDDETPWCGTFVAHCLMYAGITPPKNWFRAKEYLTYGTACARENIPFGAICVKSRTGGGHVFFAVAQSEDGNTIYGLGGNQSNMVNIMAFPRSVIDGARWPSSSYPQTPLPKATASQINAASAGGSES